MKDDRRVGIVCLTVIACVSGGAIIAMALVNVPTPTMNQIVPTLGAVATTCVGAIAGVIKGMVSGGDK